MNYRTIFFFLLVLPFGSYAQSDPLLDGYIRQALEQNQSLQRQYLELAQAEARQTEARNLFLPTVAVNARYSVAHGGRAIDIPVGDLVNPIYSNLNLINGIGEATNPDYPDIPTYQSIENVQENFLRTREHETKLTLIQPVYNPAIIQNFGIQKDLHQIERLRVQSGTRELVESVKLAYYQYGQSVELLRLYEETLELVEENLRTTESLYTHNQVNRDAVYAAEVRVSEIEVQLAEARRQEKTARAWFNFLLQRDPESEIEVGTSVEAVVVPELESLYARALQGREELQQMSMAASVNDRQVKLARGSFLPTLNLVADYGFQGTEYGFGPEDDFAMGSVVLSWSLFDQSASAKVQQARIAQDITANRTAELADQIELQVLDAYYRYEAAVAQRDLSDAQLRSASEAYRMVDARYRQGQANQVEWTEARTRLTQAGQQQIISRYQVLIQLATIEKVCATYPISN